MLHPRLKTVLTCAMLAVGLSCTQANAQDVPLPDRNPLRLESATPPVEAPPHPRERDAEEWTAQDIQTANDECNMMLDGAGVVYRPIEPIREGVCGTPAPIEVSSTGTEPQVAIEPPARMTCGMAASLSTWSDTVLQPAAKAHLDSRIVAIRNVASYVCRNRYNDATARVSEHARANALDMAAFKTREGKWITVLESWGEKEPPEEQPPAPSVEASGNSQQPASAPHEGQAVPSSAQEISEVIEHALTPNAAFLQDLHAGGCRLFGTVLGPDANDAHKDHFHFDQAPRKHSNYCE